MSTPEDMAYDGAKEREMEDSPVIGKCQMPGCHGNLRLIDGVLHCSDCDTEVEPE